MTTYFFFLSLSRSLSLSLSRSLSLDLLDDLSFSLSLSLLFDLDLERSLFLLFLSILAFSGLESDEDERWSLSLSFFDFERPLFASSSSDELDEEERDLLR